MKLDTPETECARPAAEPPRGADEDGPKLWKADDLRPSAQPGWLARNRLPRGAVSLLVGDEGIGKSLLWVWVAAAVTTGKPMPEFGIAARDPGLVVVVATEDDWASTVRPRLEVAGADLALVQVMCEREDGSGTPVFPRDIPLIADANPTPAMVVVDAWLDTVPAGLNIGDPRCAREVLQRWRELATATDAAVMLVCHTNRVAAGGPRQRYAVTSELRKTARMSLYAQADDDGRLIVGPEKTNISAPVNASVFEIEAVPYFPVTGDGDGAVPRLAYAADIDCTAGELMTQTGNGHSGIDFQDRSDTQRWLSDFLTQEGPSPSDQVKKEALQAGFTDKMVRTARKGLGVEIRRRGMPSRTVWSLPDQPDHHAPAVVVPVSAEQGTTGTTGDGGPVSADQDRSAQSCPLSDAGHDKALPMSAMPTQPGCADQSDNAGAHQLDARTAVPGDLTASAAGWTPRVQEILGKLQGPAHPPTPEAGGQELCGVGVTQ